MNNNVASSTPLLGRGRGRRIGLFGGSFNPIHCGHIALARQLLTLAALDEVWFMVSPQNPLKQSADLLDDRLRFLLARIALHGEQGLRASDYEFALPRPSYTWNTLQHLHRDYPQHTFVLLIGADNWQRFPQWYRGADILRDHQVVVYPRHGSDILPDSLPTGVTLAATPLLNVSSTDIRQRVRNGAPLRPFVPEPIIPLVRRLYR